MIESLKALINRSRWKRYLLGRSRSEEKAKRRFAEYRRTLHDVRPARKHSRGFSRTAEIAAPASFSLIDNPDQVIAFLKQVKILTNTRNVFVDLSQLSSLTPEAIAVLLATLHHPKIGRGKMSGSLPTDGRLRAMLARSGFHDYVKSNDDDAYRIPAGKVSKRRSGSRDIRAERFDQTLATELISFATYKLHGSPGQHRPSYRVFVEAMLNTLNHASENAGDPEFWWSSVFHDESRDRACFSFIDQGVGIFRSQRLTALLKVYRTLGITTNAEVLEKLLEGQIPSSTKIPGRGNGLPGMYAHCKASRIRRLVIISNDAYADVENAVYKPLKNPFGGTIVYWEIE